VPVPGVHQLKLRPNRCELLQITHCAQMDHAPAHLRESCVRRLKDRQARVRVRNDFNHGFTKRRDDLQRCMAIVQVSIERPWPKPPANRLAPPPVVETLAEPAGALGEPSEAATGPDASGGAMVRPPEGADLPEKAA
jgi:hypothetical protein